MEDCFEQNGPLKVVRNSHTKKLYNHHNNKNFFVGKINTKKEKIKLNKTISITREAGTVVFFIVEQFMDLEAI